MRTLVNLFVTQLALILSQNHAVPLLIFATNRHSLSCRSLDLSLIMSCHWTHEVLFLACFLTKSSDLCFSSCLSISIGNLRFRRRLVNQRISLVLVDSWVFFVTLVLFIHDKISGVSRGLLQRQKIDSWRLEIILLAYNKMVILIIYRSLIDDRDPSLFRLPGIIDRPPELCPLITSHVLPTQQWQVLVNTLQRILIMLRRYHLRLPSGIPPRHRDHLFLVQHCSLKLKIFKNNYFFTYIPFLNNFYCFSRLVIF